MSAILTDLRRTILPDRGDKDGPLPQLLLAMTLVTGLVDAFSYLVLGHVFVANMTGNVVFLGFALVGAPGFSIGASMVALASFSFGAVAGGRVGATYVSDRGRLLNRAVSIQVVLLVVSVVLASLSGDPIPAGYRYALIVVLGAAMGVQNAAARKLAVADLTTTVLTLTITGISADSVVAGGKGSRAGRRLVPVVAMFIGALVGAALVLHVHIALALGAALLVSAIIGVISWRLGAGHTPWAGM